MAAPDADQSGLPKKKPGIPLFVVIGGGLIVAYLIYRSRRTAAQTQPPLVPAVTTDPNTGLPIDPLTGLPYTGVGPSSSQQDITTWVAQAESWARSHNMDAGLVSKAIYDYTNGNTLGPREANILEKILAGIGYPPIVLPWKGPTGNNPTTHNKGPWFNPSTWKWWNAGKNLAPKGSQNYPGEPKFVGAKSPFIDVLGSLGGLIRMPLSGAPIYALLPGGLLPNAQGYDPKAALRWRRLDAPTAFALVPTGTKIGTLQSWNPARAA